MQKDEIVKRASGVIFDRPLIVNTMRAVIAEAIIDAYLPDGWEWCSADYAAYDFVHKDGTKLEVKQSAARQSWASENGKQPRPAFDVAARKQHWVGDKVFDFAGRHADIYVFCFHPVTSDDADHREPEQWEFYVLPTTALPDQKTLSLSRVKALTAGLNCYSFAERVERIRRGL